MVIRRASALAALGALAAGALTLGVAAPAQAVEVSSLRSYMLTVPPSVYSSSAGYSAAEQTVYRDLARNTPDKDDVYAPAAPSTGWRGQVGTGAAIWAGGTALLSAGGTLGTIFTVNPDQLEQRYEEQGLSDNDWWTQFNCERLGDDWLGSIANAINDFWTGLIGIDCDAARGDDLEKNDAWEPLAVEDPGVFSYPFTLGGVTFGVPFWSTTQVLIGTTLHNRVEGWVIPVSGTFNSSVAPQFTAVTYGPSGKVDQAGVRTTFSGAFPTNLRSRSAECPASANFGCVITDAWFSSTTGLEAAPGVNYNWLNPAHWPLVIAAPDLARTFGSSTDKPVKGLKYSNPVLGGSAPGPDAGADVVFLTTAETADGNTYQCRTRPFKETDVDVPQPCDPAIPAGQWEVSRTVEMIPADATNWTVGSDPRRIMTEQQTPQEYRNWRTAFPSCATEVCLMDLRSPAGSCFDQGDACNGWLSDPDKVGKYTCTYDGQTIALSECEAAYPNVFDKTAREQGQAYPQPSGAPATSSPIQTSTSPAPVTAPGSWPATPEQPRNCFPTGWGLLNPVEWVYKPVRCALEWAFVPRQSYVDNVMGNMRFVWTSSSLVSLLGVLGDGADLFLGPTGCEGPAIDLNIYGSSYSGHPLSACGAPFAQAASFSFVFTGIAAWVMAVASIARSIAGVVAFKGIGGDSS